MNRNSILFVDDEEVIRDLFETAFKNAGYSIKTASNGQEALELLSNEDFPLVFVDIKMPGIGGIELSQHIRKKNPDVIIFAVTGFSSEYSEDAIKNAGFDGCFFKPVPVSTLLEAAANVFRRIG